MSVSITCGWFSATSRPDVWSSRSSSDVIASSWTPWLPVTDSPRASSAVCGQPANGVHRRSRTVNGAQAHHHRDGVLQRAQLPDHDRRMEFTVGVVARAASEARQPATGTTQPYLDALARSLAHAISPAMPCSLTRTASAPSVVDNSARTRITCADTYRRTPHEPPREARTTNVVRPSRSRWRPRSTAFSR